MARLLPPDPPPTPGPGPHPPELRTLAYLEDNLPDEFTVYHGAHWVRADGRVAAYGEIDFIIVNRYGRVLVIEQKNGALDVDGADFIKTYATGQRRVLSQVTRNIGGLQSGFGRRFPGKRLDIDHLLYLPDHDAGPRMPASVDPSRVVDARSPTSLAERILAIFDDRAMPTTGHDVAGATPPDPEDVHFFFQSRVEVTPNVDAISRQARDAYLQLSGGLATWARRLSITPYRLHVQGTAGSGKTQLALDELREARIAGRRAMYLCFNRPLAEAMQRAAPTSSICSTFHELAASLMREQGLPIDYTQPGIFDRIAQGFIDSAERLRGIVDVLVIDEGQDFEPTWTPALMGMVRPDGCALWLEDPAQNLYARAPAAPPGWVRLNSPVNHRSPLTIVELINRLELTDEPQQAGGTVHGFDMRLHPYDPADGTSLLAATAAAVSEMVAAGHAPADIAVLTWRGLAHSRIAGLDTLAGHPTRRFAGTYYDAGRAVLTGGSLMLETLFRFKGQAADAVVITEIDFSQWDENARRRLFVGLTRARLRVALVASEKVAQLIEDRLG